MLRFSQFLENIVSYALIITGCIALIMQTSGVAAAGCSAPKVYFDQDGFGFSVDGPCALSHYTPTYCDGTTGLKVEDKKLDKQDQNPDKDDFKTRLNKEIKSISWKAGPYKKVSKRQCSSTPTPSPSPSASPNPSVSPSPIPSTSPTPYPSETPTPTPTATPSASSTPTPTPTPSPTATPSASPTPTPSASPSPTPTPTPGSDDSSDGRGGTNPDDSGSVLGTSTDAAASSGQVLGTTTLAATGDFDKQAALAMLVLGAGTAVYSSYGLLVLRRQ